jgi:hypothetical protein
MGLVIKGGKFLDYLRALLASQEGLCQSVDQGKETKLSVRIRYCKFYRRKQFMTSLLCPNVEVNWLNKQFYDFCYYCPTLVVF